MRIQTIFGCVYIFFREKINNLFYFQVKKKTLFYLRLLVYLGALDYLA